MDWLNTVFYISNSKNHLMSETANKARHEIYSLFFFHSNKTSHQTQKFLLLFLSNSQTSKTRSLSQIWKNIKHTQENKKNAPFQICFFYNPSSSHHHSSSSSQAKEGSRFFLIFFEDEHWNLHSIQGSSLFFIPVIWNDDETGRSFFSRSPESRW